MADEERDGGNFTAGLVLGTLAGVAGMFLFGTKKGNKTLGQLKAKWEKIKPQVEAELVERGHQLEKSRKPFLQAVGEIVDYVAEKLETGEGKRKTGSGKALLAPKAKKNVFRKG